MSEQEEKSPAELRPGLKKLRRRRWFLGGAILIYIPAIWVSLEVTGSDRATGVVFAVWLVITAVASIMAALAKCPNCGNWFHVNGVIPMYLRRCLHCGLHVSADKKRK